MQHPTNADAHESYQCRNSLRTHCYSVNYSRIEIVVFYFLIEIELVLEATDWAQALIARTKGSELHFRSLAQFYVAKINRWCWCELKIFGMFSRSDVLFHEWNAHSKQWDMKLRWVCNASILWLSLRARIRVNESIFSGFRRVTCTKNHVCVHICEWKAMEPWAQRDHSELIFGCCDPFSSHS